MTKFDELILNEKIKLQNELKDIELCERIIPEMLAQNVFVRKINNVIHCKGSIEEFMGLKLHMQQNFMTKNGCIEFSDIVKSEHSIQVNPVRIQFSEWADKLATKLMLKVNILGTIYNLWYELTENVLGKIAYNYEIKQGSRGQIVTKDIYGERYEGKLSNVIGFRSIKYYKTHEKYVSTIDVFFEYCDEVINFLNYCN